MTTRRNLFFLFLCLTAFKAISHEAPPPQSINELKSLLESEMKRQHVAGMMLTIVTADSVLYAGGLGYADVENNVPVTDKHLFRQASITKLFTSLGVLSLAAEGKLRLDSRLRDVAPEVPFKNKWEDIAPVTIAQLMEHSTGFSDKSPMEDFNFEREQMDGLDAVKVFQKHMVSRWKPGERHAYAAVNYAILAYLTEKISGKPFQEYMREKVFSPLGMPNANVSLTGGEPATYSKGYIRNGNQYGLVPHHPQYNPGYGSLNASAVDFAYALQAYLHNWQTPQGQFLSKELLHESETPHTYLSAKAGLQNTYAYGNESREVNGLVFRGHAGSIAGFLSNFLYSRELGLGFAFTINTSNHDFHRYATELIGHFLTQHLLHPTDSPVYPLQEALVKPFLGYYRLSSNSDLYMGYFQGLQNTFKLEQHQEALQVNFLLGGSMTWKAADPRRLLFTNEWAKDPRILFMRDGENQPVIVEDTMYFEKVSTLAAWTPIVLLLLCLFVMLSAILFAFVSTITMLLRRKKGLYVYLIRLSPALATLGLLLSLWVIPQFINHISAGVPISSLTMLWTIGRYLFAFFVLLTLVLLVLHWRALQSRWLKGYMVAVAVCGCYLLTILVNSHWY